MNRCRHGHFTHFSFETPWLSRIRRTLRDLPMVSSIQIFALALLTSISGISSCSNNFHPILKGQGNTIVSPPASNGSSSFVLNRVTVVNTATQTLALIGDSSNTFGSLCQTSSNASGASPCTCTFAIGTQQVDTPVTYVEQNLVRCSYAIIPSTTASVKISLHFTIADTYSNSVTFSLASGGISFDSTNINNFVSPTRFQCRDVVSIPYLLDGSVYDPYQSDAYQNGTLNSVAAHLTYPLDFYTSNLGLSMEAYIDAFAANPSLKNWDCPNVLNPTASLIGDQFNSASPISKYMTSNLMNLRVYSKAPLNSNSLIYPPTSSADDRSTFYLAKPGLGGKSPGGVFTVPVNALIAPNVNSSTQGITDFASSPLGYGAPPIPNGIGTGSESCSYSSSSVPIPSNYKWMKLWLFRSTLPQRNALGSTSLYQKVQSISCNPGDYLYNDGSSGGSVLYLPIFTGCYKQYSHLTTAAELTQRNNSFYSIALSDVDVSAQHYFADRYLASGECIRLQNPTKVPCYSNSGIFPGASCSGTNLDNWEIELPYARSSTIYPNAYAIGCGTWNGTTGSVVSDPFGLCKSQSPLYVNDNASGANTGQGVTPSISTQGDVFSANLDTSGARFDYLFVVSPPDVTIADMQSSTSKALPYQPVRFKLASDCAASNPNDPSCLTSNLLVYDMKLHDIGTQGDPPADDPNNPIVFPVCVLQPK